MKTKLIISFVILITLLTISKTNSQWQQTGMTTGSVSSIVSTETHIFASINPNQFSSGVISTSDNGVTWNGTGISGTFKLSSNMDHIFAARTAGYSQIYKSTNDGLNWDMQNLPYADGLWSIAANENNVYIGAVHYGITRSSNNGIDWSSISGLGGSIYSIAAQGSYIFINKENNGIYLSTDNGLNFLQSSLTGKEVNAIVINGNTIFAGTANFGVYISTDNGSSWNQSSLNTHTVQSIAASGNNIFAGTDSSGVFFSNNNGTNWIQINQGLPNLFIGALFINGNFIYAGTGGAGIWKRPLSDLLAVQNISSEIPKEYGLSQNYPNPFNPTTNFEFRIANYGFVNITIYDIQGKEVSTILNEELKPGTYKADFDGSKFASGVYFYRLVSGDFSDVKKMILVK